MLGKDTGLARVSNQATNVLKSYTLPTELLKPSYLEGQRKGLGDWKGAGRSRKRQRTDRHTVIHTLWTDRQTDVQTEKGNHLLCRGFVTAVNCVSNRT